MWKMLAQNIKISNYLFLWKNYSLFSQQVNGNDFFFKKKKKKQGPKMPENE